MSEENKEILTEEEESTVFSAPKEHTDDKGKPNKKKNILLSVIALVLVAAITLTVFFALPEITDDEDEDGDTSTAMFEESLFEKVTSAELINSNGNVLFSKEEATDSEGKTEIRWVLSEIDNSLTDFDEIEATVNALMQVPYKRELSDNKNDGKDYGFESPSYTVKFGGENEFSLIIGNNIPDNTGRYATATNKDGVYLIDELDMLDFNKTELDLAVKENLTPFTEDNADSKYFQDGTLYSFDALTVSSKTLGGSYSFSYVEVDNTVNFSQYHIISPEKRAADDNGVLEILGLFNAGFTSAGCYSFETGEYDIKRFGLDKPDFVAELTLGDVTKTVKATKQDDGYYAVITSDTKTVIKLSSDQLGIAAYTKKDLCNSFLFIENIVSLSQIKVESGSKSIVFDLEREDEDEDGTFTVSAVSAGGKELDLENFKSYYQYLLSVAPVSYDSADTKGLAPETVLTLYHVDGSAPTVIKYYKVSAGRYSVENNGLQMGLISSANHSYVYKYAENVTQDKSYNSR